MITFVRSKASFVLFLIVSFPSFLAEFEQFVFINTFDYRFYLQVIWIVFKVATTEDVSLKKTNLFACAITVILEKTVVNVS